MSPAPKNKSVLVACSLVRYARHTFNLPRLASRPWLPLHAAPAPLLPSRSAGRVRASRGSERDSVAPGSRRCCGVFVPRCPAGVVPVPFRQRGKLPRRTDFGAWLTQTTYGRDIQWLIDVKGGGGRNHTQVIGRNHTPLLPLPQCHKDR